MRHSVAVHLLIRACAQLNQPRSKVVITATLHPVLSIHIYFIAIPKGRPRRRRSHVRQVVNFGSREYHYICANIGVREVRGGLKRRTQVGALVDGNGRQGDTIPPEQGVIAAVVAASPTVEAAGEPTVPATAVPDLIVQGDPASQEFPVIRRTLGSSAPVMERFSGSSMALAKLNQS